MTFFPIMSLKLVVYFYILSNIALWHHIHLRCASVWGGIFIFYIDFTTESPILYLTHNGFLYPTYAVTFPHHHFSLIQSSYVSRKGFEKEAVNWIGSVTHTWTLVTIFQNECEKTDFQRNVFLKNIVWLLGIMEAHYSASFSLLF